MLNMAECLENEFGYPAKTNFTAGVNATLDQTGGEDMFHPNPVPPTPADHLEPSQRYEYVDIVDRYLKRFTARSTKYSEPRGVEWFREHGFDDDPVTNRRPYWRCYEYCMFYPIGNASYQDGDLYGIPLNPYPGRRLALYNWRDVEEGMHIYDLVTAGTPIPHRDGNIVIGGKNYVAPTVVPGWGEHGEYMGRIKAELDATALPAWIPNYTNIDYASTPPNLYDEFDMFAVNWKTSMRNNGLGGMDSNVWLKEMFKKYSNFDDYTYLHIHPKTAAEKGLKNGDRVRVTSQHVKHNQGAYEAYAEHAFIIGRVKITNLVHEKVLGFPAQGGWRSKYMLFNGEGPNFNQLLRDAPPYNLPDAGAIPVNCRVKIEKI
jgi:hypothetical protein